MSVMEGDHDAAMKALGETIRALDAPDQWRILAAALNALDKSEQGVYIAQEGIFGNQHAVRWNDTASQWRYSFLV